MEQHLKASKFLKDRPRLGRTQAISQEAVKNVFENDPCQKMTRLEQKKKSSVSTVSRIVKKMGGKSLRCSRNRLLSATMAQKHLERSTRLLNSLKNHGKRIFLFPDEKTFIADPVFNKQNGRIDTFGKDVSEHCRVSTTKRPSSIMMIGVVASTVRGWLRFGLKGDRG